MSGHGVNLKLTQALSLDHLCLNGCRQTRQHNLIFGLQQQPGPESSRSLSLQAASDRLCEPAALTYWSSSTNPGAAKRSRRLQNHVLLRTVEWDYEAVR